MINKSILLESLVEINIVLKYVWELIYDRVINKRGELSTINTF